MTLFLLYLWLKLDTFHEVFFWFTVVPVIGFVGGNFAGAMMRTDSDSNEAAISVGKILNNYLMARWKLFVAISLIALVLDVTLPTQRQGAYLIAGYAGMKLVETPEMSKLTELVRIKVGTYLDDELKSAKAEAAKHVASAVTP